MVAGLSVLLFGSCVRAHTQQKMTLPQESGTTWVQIEPRQCEDPVSQARAWNAADFVGSMTDYYQRQGVEVRDVRMVSWDEAVCEACHICPAGYTLYLRVSDSDLPELLSKAEYRIVEPDHETRPSDDQRPRSAR